MNDKSAWGVAVLMVAVVMFLFGVWVGRSPAEPITLDTVNIVSTRIKWDNRVWVPIEEVK
jgi:hypothetical protein